MSTLPATRAAALSHLNAFVPRGGRSYAANRNFDRGLDQHTDVSMLSPYIRHRLITEQEVVAAVLEQHNFAAAEKFIQEVCWRTYWKGWFEQHADLWPSYCAELERCRSELQDDLGLAGLVAAAERGDTGLTCFDAWARELVATGYLHNHARMWFASIWIFTLKLPWALGADFFYRHLLDGDPASNTLSWRWVAGLHTKGKTYLARPDNIAHYTDARFCPDVDELAPFAIALDDDVWGTRCAIRTPIPLPSSGKIVYLLTDEDLHPESLDLGALGVAAVAVFPIDDTRAAPVRAFKTAALADAARRAAEHFACSVEIVTSQEHLADIATASKARAVVTAMLPIGRTRDRVMSWATALPTPIAETQRAWDAFFWPHAKAGFFGLKDKIPAVLSKLDLWPKAVP